MTRIRFRTDNYTAADERARLKRGEPLLWLELGDLVGVEPARPGDIWIVRWWKPNGDGPLAGYAICCPKCGQVHNWTTARNCSAPKTEYGSCIHNGTGSCWVWTGSAENGTLTASPSLYSLDDNPTPGKNGHGCGWHGWLRDGVLSVA